MQPHLNRLYKTTPLSYMTETSRGAALHDRDRRLYRQACCRAMQSSGAVFEQTAAVRGTGLCYNTDNQTQQIQYMLNFSFFTAIFTTHIAKRHLKAIVSTQSNNF